MKNNQKIRVRIAPSPTGNLHIGTARSALFNYLFAKQNEGTFIVRIEDTDTKRSTEEFEKNILDGLTWLNLAWDELYKQSERTDIYKKYLDTLIQKGYAYQSREESIKEDQRSSVIRFKNPNKIITFKDMIRGEITFDTTELGDFVIAKSLEEPLYHLAVVVDDYEMNITHIIRGEDHISNTPRQILIQEAIGAPVPTYAHIPLILSKERKKLSKRDGATSLIEYKKSGYIKESLINFLAFLGWHPEGDEELLNESQLIGQFDITRVQKGGAIFDVNKLDWFNKEYIKKIPSEDFKKLIKKYSGLDLHNNLLTSLIQEKITTLNDIQNICAQSGEFAHLLYDDLHIEDTHKILWKEETPTKTKEHLSYVISVLKNIPEDEFLAHKIKELLWDYATEKGRGSVLWPVRYALSGLEKSPDPFSIMEIIGKQKSLVRLENAFKNL